MIARSDSPHRHWSARLILVLACLVFAGCWDYNKTFRNNQGQSLTCLKIIVKLDKPATSFPAVDEWYKGNSPDSITDLGDGSMWELKWCDVVPAGGEIHVGWEFKDSGTGFKEIFGGFSRIHLNSNEPSRQGALVPPSTLGTFEFGSIALDTFSDPDLGLVLEVSIDPASPTAVQVTDLEWVATTSALPLLNLIFGDPLMESLPWTDVPGGAPFVMSPGSPPRIFDIPDDALVGQSYGLVRYVAADTRYGFGQEAVYQNPLVPGDAR